MLAQYYNSLPVNKMISGLLIDFGEKNMSSRYCWLPDTPSSRYYVSKIKGLRISKIYVGWRRAWMKVDVFVKYSLTTQYEKDKQHKFDYYKSTF